MPYILLIRGSGKPNTKRYSDTTIPRLRVEKSTMPSCCVLKFTRFRITRRAYAPHILTCLETALNRPRRDNTHKVRRKSTAFLFYNQIFSCFFITPLPFLLKFFLKPSFFTTDSATKNDGSSVCSAVTGAGRARLI